MNIVYDLLLLKPLAGSEKTRYAVAAPFSVHIGDVVQLNGNSNLFAVRNVENGVSRNTIDIVKAHNSVGSALCRFAPREDVSPAIDEVQSDAD